MNRKLLGGAATAAAVIIAIPTFLILMLAGLIASEASMIGAVGGGAAESSDQTPTGPDCGVTPADGAGQDDWQSASDSIGAVSVDGISLAKDQIANVKTIIGVAKARGIPERGWEVALTAALQESMLRNLSSGDRDSVGLFQERPSMGWGTAKQLTDPVYASVAFFGGKDVPPDNNGLIDYTGWTMLSIPVAAQKVEASGAPDAYQKWAGTAHNLATKYKDAPAVHGLHKNNDPGTGAPPGGGCGGGTGGDVPAGPLAAKAVAIAMNNLGIPYSLGGGTPSGPTVGATSPAGWDCSSFVQMAYYRASGGKILLPRVTYDQMDSKLVTEVPLNKLQPGDLIFIKTGAEPGFGHVVMFIGHGKLVEEPHTGAFSRVMPMSEYNGYVEAARRVVAK